MEQRQYERRRKWMAGISVAVVIALAILVTLFIWKWLADFSQEEFREYIQSFGPLGWAVLLGLQFLQVFIALIPGEILESAAGYAFGPIIGTGICYLGVALASTCIFLMTRRFGVRLVEIFVSREKIRILRFLNTEKKRDAILFLLFFIPGTPKDLLTYFVGLTEMKLSTFLIISLVARMPSVLSSTIGGHWLGEGQYMHAMLLYVITGAISIFGLWLYDFVVRKKRREDQNEFV